MAETERLKPLREAIAEVDRSLLELLRRRMELAAEVGRVKAAAGVPVVVRDVEERVLTRARQHAEMCGVSEEVMEAVFQAIIRSSVERQYRVGVELRAERGRHVLILGGAGAMGTWLRGFLQVVGHHVDVLDPAWSALPGSPGRFSSLAGVEDLDAYDYLIVAVPLGSTPAVVGELLERRPAATVVEVASIKEHLRPALDEARRRGVWVSSLHPMFGPAKSPYEPLTFVLACQRDAAPERERLDDLLRHPYSQIVALPFDHHDRLMGWLLGLAHLTGMLFGSALTRSGLEPRELHACASTTFLRQASTSLSVLSEDPDLYLDIQRLNPHREEVFRAVRDALGELVNCITAFDLEAFRNRMAAARRALGSLP
jgi:chorismate mutase / prephenate dehydrogenase